ncbi:hypothetical protein Tco_0784644 [Tanacetum coccineum]
MRTPDGMSRVVSRPKPPLWWRAEHHVTPQPPPWLVSGLVVGIYFLAWMGWNADIEGRGLGELCTIGNTGAYPPRVVRFYNYNSEGHIAKQCTAKKRAKDSEWFKDKILLAQAQEA